MRRFTLEVSNEAYIIFSYQRRVDENRFLYSGAVCFSNNKDTQLNDQNKLIEFHFSRSQEDWSAATQPRITVLDDEIDQPILEHISSMITEGIKGDESGLSSKQYQL